ncbi:hypothetical protein PR048_023346, partial [Dryococelus australis]
MKLLLMQEISSWIYMFDIDTHKRIVINHFLFCYEFGHATADILKDKLLDSLSRDTLPLKKLLAIGSDGPLVNAKCLRDLDSHLKSEDCHGLINIGTCNLHIVYNSSDGACQLTYKCIKSAFEDPSTLVRLMFLKSVGEIYDKFRRLMQCNEPHIYILYHELCALIQSLMSRIMKPEILRKVSGATFRSLDLHNIENTFPSEEIDVGCVTRKEYLLHNIQCLHSLFRHESHSLKFIQKVAELMPIIIKSCDIDKLCDEWKLIDAYWSALQKIRNRLRELKYPLLSCLVIAALTLSHGQADVEQGFSMNKHFISPSCSLLTAQTINGIRTVQSVIKLRGGVCQVPLSPMCLKYFRDASSKYKAYLEDCKKEKSELDSKSKRNDGVEILENLKKEEKTLQEAIQASHCLIGEANKRDFLLLNMQEICVVQALLEAGHKQLTEKTAALKKLKKKKHVLSPR